MARFRRVIRGPCNCPRRSTFDAQGQAQPWGCCLPSLFRLKVINALVQATREGRSPGVRGVPACMQASSSELTIVSVREVLKRLAGVGVIVFQPDRTYRFTNQAWEMLKPDIGVGLCKINSL